MSQSLHCFVYKSLRKQETFLFVLHENDFSRVPEPLLDALGKVEKLFELHLTPERQMARGKASHIMHDLLEKGFHLQLPPTEKSEPID